MAGIYIHIPFCRKACHYCNFHFSTSLSAIQPMAEALEKELLMRKEELPGIVETIYFGGGTPSILPEGNIEKLMDSIRQHFKLSDNPEITLEANPDDISSAKAQSWKAMGINRFSIGIQSFEDRNLQWMNRAHDAAQSIRCIETIREAGFDNFSIDLIYGTPGQDAGSWIADLNKAIGFKIPHLSCYALTVESGTALHHLIGSGKKEQVSPDDQADRFQSLLALTAEAGYEHYEISNFSLPGKASKHNSAYWDGVPYLGIGPSAHSFYGNIRSWNIEHNQDYIKSIEAGKRPYTAETLCAVDLLNEYIMTALRSSRGINKAKLVKQWGADRANAIELSIGPHLQAGNIVSTESGWKLSDHGKFLADGIASDLFILGESQ
jgi:oxygen-independent coproporphyrinogen III oxidase